MVIQRSIFWLGVSLVLGVGLAVWIGAGAAQADAPNAVTSGAAGRPVLAGPREELPASVRGLALSSKPQGVPDALFEGAWLAREARRVVSSPTGSQPVLYAVPTDRGHVCYVVVIDAAAAGGCEATFTAQHPAGVVVYDRDQINTGAPVVVAGLVPNDVWEVDVTAAGGEQRALLRNSGFVLELPNAQAYPEQVILRYRNGGIRTMAIPDSRPGVLAQNRP